MADDTDQLSGSGEVVQNVQCVIDGLGIEGAEALVDKQRTDLNAAVIGVTGEIFLRGINGAMGRRLNPDTGLYIFDI